MIYDKESQTVVIEGNNLPIQPRHYARPSDVIGPDKKNPICSKCIQNSSSDPYDLGEL